jgi:SAM-dependent methyltransferase
MIGREIARFCRKLPDHGRLLDIGCGEGARLEVAQQTLGANWQLEGVGADRAPDAPDHGGKFVMHRGRVEELDLPDGAYDVVLLIGVVEAADNPLTTLKVVKELLRPGGLVLIATPNTRSTACSIFRGRHWSGYNFPRHWNLFDGKSLGRAAGLAGLALASVHTCPAAGAWIESVRNLMVDWGAPHWALATVSRPSGAARAAAAAIEWSQQMRSNGGLLVATLRRCAP